MPFPASFFFNQRIQLLALLIITTIIYYPALNTPFLLDDYFNLGQLELIDSKGYSYYIFGGSSGPSGRPVSLATFALQHGSWPADPFSFKIFNLVIHLINGVLIFFLSRFLSRHVVRSDRDIAIISILVTAWWLLHPIQISTVLYTVQRMTQLSAFFVLFGIVGYLYSRAIYFNKNGTMGLMGMSLAVFTGTVFGVLAKENAILLPLLILVIELTLLGSSARTRIWNIWAVVFLVLPLLLLLVYFSLTFSDVISNYSNRAYTSAERLLTQPLVLFDYIKVLLLPHPSAFALYHDDYPYSTGIFSPIFTLFAMLGILGLIIIAFLYKRRFAVISFGIFWFIGAHLLEASHLNLELYFEHRNYLPAYGLIFMITCGGLLVWRSTLRKKTILALLFLYSSLVLATTAAEINLWANPVLQSNEWVRNHPTSRRAIDNLGDIYLRQGRHEEAMQTYYQITENYPGEIYPVLKEISIRNCLLQEQVSKNLWDKVFVQAESAKWYWNGPVTALDQMVKLILQGKCTHLELSSLTHLISILVDNPDYKKSYADLYEFLTSVAVHLDDGQSALENINKALTQSQTIHRKLYKTKILFALKEMEKAEILLAEIKRSLMLNPSKRLAFRDEILFIEKQYMDKKM